MLEYCGHTGFYPMVDSKTMWRNCHWCPILFIQILYRHNIKYLKTLQGDFEGSWRSGFIASKLELYSNIFQFVPAGHGEIYNNNIYRTNKYRISVVSTVLALELLNQGLKPSIVFLIDVTSKQFDWKKRCRNIAPKGGCYSYFDAFPMMIFWSALKMWKQKKGSWSRRLYDLFGQLAIHQLTVSFTATDRATRLVC